MSKIKCVIVAEGEVDSEVYELASMEEAAAFIAGVETGSGLYGAGGCYVIADYQPRGDFEDMEEGDEDFDDVWNDAQEAFKRNMCPIQMP